MKRNYLMDNMKGLLIFLVVLGHLITISGLLKYSIGKVIWIIIYSFHMPAFIFVSGFLSQKYRHSINVKGIISLLLYYVIGCCGVYFMQFLTYGKTSFHSILISPFAMWYFITLIFYRITLPVLDRIPCVLVLSFLLSILAGTIPQLSPVLSISRTISFLPFFLMGAIWATPGRMREIKYSSRIIRSIVCFLWINYLIKVILGLDFNRNILWMRCSFSSGGLSNLDGLATRLAAVVTATLLIPTLLSFMPDKKTFISRWGKNSLSVYLFHAWLYWPIKRLATACHFNTFPIPVRMVFLVVISLELTELLSSNHLSHLLAKLSNPTFIKERKMPKREIKRHRKIKRFAAFLIVLAVVASSLQLPVSAKSPESKKTFVLMIGNSLTMMPSNTTIENLKGLARKSGKELYIQSVSRYGEKLKNWANPGIREGKRARKAIKSRKWDCIVLQDNTDSAIFAKDTLVKSSKKLALYIRKTNPDARIIYNATWCYEKTTRSLSQKKQQQKMNESYQLAASETQGSVSWSGSAFQKYRETKGAKELYLKDKNHGSKYGWYLNACCLFSEIFNTSAETVPYYGGLTKTHAKRMQKIAADLQLGE